MTEDQMKDTTCHKTLVAVVIDGRGEFYPVACLGSRCSAWRWVERTSDADFDKPPHGYCGIAGKP